MICQPLLSKLMITPDQLIKFSTLMGITSQLFETRMSKLISRHDLTSSQFALLNHLARHQGENESVSDLTDALELNQPAITKIVQKLTKKGLVETRKDEQDSRKKWVTITPTGLQAIGTVMRDLGPDVSSWFEEWTAEDLDRFNADLDRLSNWLDQNRLT